MVKCKEDDVAYIYSAGPYCKNGVLRSSPFLTRIIPDTIHPGDSMDLLGALFSGSKGECQYLCQNLNELYNRGKTDEVEKLLAQLNG